MAKSNEKIRELITTVHIAGILAELESRTGTDKNGNNYLSIKGAVQCHPTDSAFTARFQFYSSELTKNGTTSKLYVSAKDWLKTVTPMTKDKENPSMVSLSGNIRQNNYVGQDGTFREDIVSDIKFFNEFQEYAYDINVEGYIKNITDEIIDDEATGRKKIVLVSKDFRGAIMFHKDNTIIAERDIAEQLDDAEYENGRTVLMRLERAKEEPKVTPKKGGFGKQPIAKGRIRTYWKLVGGDPALDLDDPESLDKGQIKDLLYVYEERNKEIVDKGYQGKKNDGGSTAGAFKETKKPVAKAKDDDFVEVDDDDELPF